MVCPTPHLIFCDVQYCQYSTHVPGLPLKTALLWSMSHMFENQRIRPKIYKPVKHSVEHEKRNTMRFHISTLVQSVIPIVWVEACEITMKPREARYSIVVKCCSGLVKYPGDKAMTGKGVPDFANTLKTILFVLGLTISRDLSAG